MNVVILSDHAWQGGAAVAADGIVNSIVQANHDALVHRIVFFKNDATSIRRESVEPAGRRALHPLWYEETELKRQFYRLVASSCRAFSRARIPRNSLLEDCVLSWRRCVPTSSTCTTCTPPHRGAGGRISSRSAWSSRRSCGRCTICGASRAAARIVSIAKNSTPAVMRRARRRRRCPHWPRN